MGRKRRIPTSEFIFYFLEEKFKALFGIPEKCTFCKENVEPGAEFKTICKACRSELERFKKGGEEYEKECRGD